MSLHAADGLTADGLTEVTIMEKRLLLAGLAVMLIAATKSSDSMRCGNKLVSAGDHQAKVKAVCGEPDHVETRTVLRAGVPRRLPAVDENIETISDTELLIHNRSLVEMEVEVWLFNRGPSRLMREVVFRDSRLVNVNVLGYGY
jgi:hypothetical protein